ncbi:MAG: uracil-DNA glycosylase family protein, partial [Bacteroidota bacterium]
MRTPVPHYDHPLVKDAANCQVCAANLPLGPKPIFQIHPEAKVVIIGHAPGRLAHLSGVPWDDPSGKRLRRWLGVTEAAFYNPAYFAILPMGFCYPGKGKGGDMPPRPECGPLWQDKLLG